MSEKPIEDMYISELLTKAITADTPIECGKLLLETIKRII